MTEAVVDASPVAPSKFTAEPSWTRPAVQCAPLFSVAGCPPGVPASWAVVPLPSPRLHWLTGGVPPWTKNLYAVTGPRLPARSTLRAKSVFSPGLVGVTVTVTGAPRLGAATGVDGGSSVLYRYEATSSTPLSLTPLESMVNVPAMPTPGCHPLVPPSDGYRPSADVTTGALSGAALSTANSHDPLHADVSMPSAVLALNEYVAPGRKSWSAGYTWA